MTLTVCELLHNFEQYQDQAVLVVGEMDHSVSLIDHYEFLMADRCASQL